MKPRQLDTEPLNGETAIDAAHGALFATLAQLVDLEDEEFGPACETLCAMLERDFRAEEDLMEGAHLPGIVVHREQHARILGGLHHALAALDLGDCSPARQAVRLLPQWLELHIATLDADMLMAFRDAVRGSKTDAK